MQECICDAGFTYETAKTEEALYRIWLDTQPLLSFQKYIIDIYYNNPNNKIKSGEQAKAYM
jgi:hypothetical protein